MDYHLIIADPTDLNETMIAEIPSPECYKGADLQLANRFADARNKVDKLFGVPTQQASTLGQDVEVGITGVGFFDNFHGQTGMAPNGLELHPVLNVDVLTNKSGTSP